MGQEILLGCLITDIDNIWHSIVSYIFLYNFGTKQFKKLLYADIWGCNMKVLTSSFDITLQIMHLKYEWSQGGGIGVKLAPEFLKCKNNWTT